MVSCTENLAAPTTSIGQQFFHDRDRFMSTDTMFWNTPSNPSPTVTSPTIGHHRAIIKSDGSLQHEHYPRPAVPHYSGYTPPQAFSGYNQMPFWGYRPSLQHSQPTQSAPNLHQIANKQVLARSPVVGSGRILPERRHPISPPPGLEFQSPLPEPSSNSYALPSQSPPSINDIASELGDIHVSPASSPPASPWSTGVTENDDDNSDSDDDSTNSHPNKYPVEIEYHDNKFCSYKRQSTRSGEKIKQKLVTFHDPITLEPQTSLQQNKHYQKHLVRICRCGQYQVMDGALQQGRTNDCNGYEIHYSQKCRWKAYDDFKTGKRVLIRLCKCYKPA